MSQLLFPVISAPGGGGGADRSVARLDELLRSYIRRLPTTQNYGGGEAFVSAPSLASQRRQNAQSANNLLAAQFQAETGLPIESFAHMPAQPSEGALLGQVAGEGNVARDYAGAYASAQNALADYVRGGRRRGRAGGGGPNAFPSFGDGQRFSVLRP